MILNQTKRILASSLGMLGVAGVALANDTTSGYSGVETMEGPKLEQKLQINPGFTYLSDADFDTSGFGDLNVWRFGIPARYTLETDPGDFSLGAFYEYSEYELGNWNEDFEFNTLAFDAVWRSMLNENWGYFVYGGVTLAASTDESLGDGLTGVGGGGVRYVWSPNLSLGLGVVVASRLEDDAALLPIIALNWQINDRWNLRTLNGATLTYDLTADKKWQVDLGVRYQRREYRVDDDASLTEKMVSGEVGATYRFNPSLAVRGFVGIAAGRNIEVRADDHKVADEDVDAAPFVGVRAMFTF